MPSSPRRKTRWTVRAAEVLARIVITFSGLSTIVAVLGVCVFLVWMAVPLFAPARLSNERQAVLALPSSGLLRCQVDEYQKMGWALYRNGELYLFRLDTGAQLEKKKLFPDAEMTAVSSPTTTDDVAAGFADGSVRLGKIGFFSRLLKDDEVSEALKKLGKNEFAPAETQIYGNGLLTRNPQGDYRLQILRVEFQPPVTPQSASPVIHLDYTRKQDDSPVFCVLTRDRILSVNTLVKTPNLLTGEDEYEAQGGRLVIPEREGKGLADFALIFGLGDNVILAWKDGCLLRIKCSDLKAPAIVESVDLLDDPRLELTALQFLIGKTTLMAGDSSGRVRAWFKIHSLSPPTEDGSPLTMAHALPPAGSAVTALFPSSQSRMLAAGFADGSVRIYQVTSEQMLVRANMEAGQPIDWALITPNDDGLVALNATGLHHWAFDPEHPETTLRTLFLPVWYEGDPQPKYVWQANGGQAYEPKFGLMPLIFGTLKATFYAMLIGVPLALLAAIYTSEFMHPRIRSVVKPAIEMMASLPSVVLGFIAALVVAQFAEQHITSVLAVLLTVPLAFLIGGHLWQLIPESRRVVLSRWRILFIALCLPLGVGAALFVGPTIEKLLFRDPSGKPSFRGWLDGNWGSGANGWVLILLPLCAVLAVFIVTSFINPWLDGLARSWSRSRNAWVAIAKFAAGCLLALGLAYGLAQGLSFFRIDPRSWIVGTYVQRNALVVGFLMGFAIIPIIYTIADDALTAVPAHLRSASLGCGATTWQTAVRVVIPTATSGLFSAVMIGLGRAVGETMIVLMAAGHTPIIDVNPFNGLRSLSANLASEFAIPPPGSTFYCTLYMAGLILFGMTFVLNTAAEAVRLRFRKRAMQL